MQMKQCIRWLWKVSEGYRLPVICCALTGAINACVSLAFVFVCKYLIDIATGASDESLGTYIGWMVTCLVVQLSLRNQKPPDDPDGNQAPQRLTQPPVHSLDEKLLERTGDIPYRRHAEPDRNRHSIRDRCHLPDCPDRVRHFRTVMRGFVLPLLAGYTPDRHPCIHYAHRLTVQ